MKSEQKVVSIRRRAILILLLCGMCGAATPGDIGGCGQPVQDLDAVIFFDTKKSIDCESCRECSISTRPCDAACRPGAALEQSFPEGCFPLVHDGAVCLRALLHASCSDYERFMSESEPETPSECNFCPPEVAP